MLWVFNHNRFFFFEKWTSHSRQKHRSCFVTVLLLLLHSEPLGRRQSELRSCAWSPRASQSQQWHLLGVNWNNWAGEDFIYWREYFSPLKDFDVPLKCTCLQRVMVACENPRKNIAHFMSICNFDQCCICVFVCQTLSNMDSDILLPLPFKKYSTCHQGIVMSICNFY